MNTSIITCPAQGCEESGAHQATGREYLGHREGTLGTQAGNTQPQTRNTLGTCRGHSGHRQEILGAKVRDILDETPGYYRP